MPPGSACRHVRGERLHDEQPGHRRGERAGTLGRAHERVLRVLGGRDQRVVAHENDRAAGAGEPVDHVRGEPRVRPERHGQQPIVGADVDQGVRDRSGSLLDREDVRDERVQQEERVLGERGRLPLAEDERPAPGCAQELGRCLEELVRHGPAGSRSGRRSRPPASGRAGSPAACRAAPRARSGAPSLPPRWRRGDPAKPPNPSFDPKRTTAALLTPTLRASESAVSKAASGMCSSSQAAMRRSFGDRMDSRDRMWEPTSTRPFVALATRGG